MGKKGGGGGFTAEPWGEVEGCLNYSTVVKTGSSPLPCSQRNMLCIGMRHRTLFPREKKNNPADTGLAP